MSNIKSTETAQARTFGPDDLTGPLMRAARALLGITAEELARRALVSVATVRRGELDRGPVRMTTANAARIIETLQRDGVVFWCGDADGGPGVRYRGAPGD